MSAVRFSVYVTGSSVMRWGGTAEGRARIIDDVLRAGANKVFLEVWRSARQVDVNVLKELRDACVEAGLEVATGLMPSHGGTLGGNSRWGHDHCYSKPETRKALRTAVEAGAALFDEFIIDDALTTQCTCHLCREARGDRSWGQFRRDTLVEISRDDIVGAAKNVNPNIKMILKFPQWYDRLAEFGYDTDRQPPLFDATWVGTETREPDTLSHGFVPQYEACFNTRWHDAAEPNLAGCWFDSIDSDKHIYVEQAYQSVLGGGRDITLFCYSDELFHDRTAGHVDNLVVHTPALKRIAEEIGNQKPVGITAVRPHNPDPGADGYLFDVLGMIGLPLVPVASWPETPPEAMLLTSHVADCPETTAETKRVVDAGGTVFITAGLLAAKDDDEEFKALAGFQRDGWSQRRNWTSGVFTVDGLTFTAGEVDWRYDLVPETAETLASVSGMTHRGPRYDVPVVTRQMHSSGGSVIVLNIHGICEEDYSMAESINIPMPLPGQNYPAPVLNVIQREIARATGRAFEAPARVAYYPFCDSTVVLENFRNEPACAILAGDALPDDVVDLLGNAGITRGEKTCIYLPARSVALLKA